MLDKCINAHYNYIKLHICTKNIKDIPIVKSLQPTHPVCIAGGGVLVQ